MNLTFLLLILGHARTNVLMFILAGVLSYAIDYRRVRDKTESKREAVIVKSTSLIFILGGTCVLCLFQALAWVV